jgi:hypothetical protein
MMVEEVVEHGEEDTAWTDRLVGGGVKGVALWAGLSALPQPIEEIIQDQAS